MLDLGWMLQVPVLAAHGWVGHSLLLSWSVLAAVTCESLPLIDAGVGVFTAAGACACCDGRVGALAVVQLLMFGPVQQCRQLTVAVCIAQWQTQQCYIIAIVLHQRTCYNKPHGGLLLGRVCLPVLSLFVR